MLPPILLDRRADQVGENRSYADHRGGDRIVYGPPTRRSSRSFSVDFPARRPADLMPLVAIVAAVREANSQYTSSGGTD